MLGIFSKIISILIVLLFSYQLVYFLVALFGKEKTVSYEKKYHNYALLICARNEELVIGDLLRSIQNQIYPKENYSTFVMADNCTDATAKIAQANGAIVYERSDLTHIGKGYALGALIKNILGEYGDQFDGFIVFDADNVLTPDYLDQMNRTYCQGNRMIASYINSKNYGSNWLSAGSSLFLLNKSRFLNRARNILGLSAAANGTGFLFSKDVLSDWPYHTLTEDIEFSVDQVCRRNRIAYCSSAVLYDEQPTSFRQSYYQRLRWAKGYLQVMNKYFIPLVKGIGEGSFACYDMLNTLLSGYGLSIFTITINLFTFLYMLVTGVSIIPFISSLALGLIRAYVLLCMVGLLTTITEWKRINAKPYHKIGYIFTYPLFIASYIPIAICALFINVTWVPTKHSVSTGAEH